MIIGVVMMAFGIVAKVNPDFIFRFISKTEDFSTSSKIYEILYGCSMFMIFLGLIVVIIGFFGWFGACCENKCLIITYGIILVVMFNAQTALITYAAVISNENCYQKMENAIATAKDRVVGFIDDLKDKTGEIIAKVKGTTMEETEIKNRYGTIAIAIGASICGLQLILLVLTFLLTRQTNKKETFKEVIVMK